MKIKVEPVNRVYEVTYLVPATLTDSEVAKINDEVTQLVAKHKGKIINTENWGKRPLAYAIRFHNNFQREGVYTLLQIEMEPTNAPELDRALQLNSQIMRHLLVKVEG